MREGKGMTTEGDILLLICMYACTYTLVHVDSSELVCSIQYMVHVYENHLHVYKH